ncbi:MAG TPA: hypothetical protein VLY87_04330 [Flavobacterium sp.]|nr:hypothetical protein [Flavobacterium sp.]
MNKNFNIHTKKVHLPENANVKLLQKQSLPLYLKQLYRAVRFTNVYSEKLSIAFANLRV